MIVWIIVQIPTLIFLIILLPVAQSIACIHWLCEAMTAFTNYSDRWSGCMVHGFEAHRKKRWDPRSWQTFDTVKKSRDIAYMGSVRFQGSSGVNSHKVKYKIHCLQTMFSITYDRISFKYFEWDPCMVFLFGQLSQMSRGMSSFRLLLNPREDD